MNDQIYNWLKGFPGLELLQRQQVDATPGGCGLFFRGVTVKDSRTNLLGQVQSLKTLNFRLCRYGDPQESPIFFLLLASWVQVNAPPLGTDPTAACENSRSTRDNGGLALWEADLEITFWEDL